MIDVHDDALPPMEHGWELISTVAKRLLQSAHPADLIEELEAYVADQLGFDFYAYRQYEPTTDRLVLTRGHGLPGWDHANGKGEGKGASHGPDPASAHSPDLARGNGHGHGEHGHFDQADPCGAIGARSVIFREDLAINPDPALADVRAMGLRAFCCLPLRSGERLLGTLEFGTRRRDSFSEQQRALLKTLADLISTGMARAKSQDEQEQMLASERHARHELQRALGAMHGLTGDLEQRVNQRTKDLTAYQTQLRNLVSELILTEQRERRRIASDLHDHLAQLLVACKMKLGVLRGHINTDPSRDVDAADDSENPLALLDQINGFLDESLGYTRNLVAKISPVLLYEQGLLPAIHWLAERVMPRHGLDVIIHEEADLSGAELNEDARILLFESVRELLFNVVEHADTKHAEVTVRRRDGGLEITVVDEGCGFPSDHAPLTEMSAHAPADGDGVGLFSIRERMALLGGRFEFTSTPNVGTRAAVWLPLGPTPIEMVALLNEPAKPIATVREGAPVASRERIRLLVVDDHAVVREGLVMMLGKEEGLVVVGEASNGRTALEMVEQLRPHAVLMDVSMPEMDGIETTGHLTAAHPEVKVIGLSMHEDTSTATAMRSAGASAYLCKGCSAEVLVETIQDAVRATHTQPADTDADVMI